MIFPIASLYAPYRPPIAPTLFHITCLNYVCILGISILSFIVWSAGAWTGPFLCILSFIYIFQTCLKVVSGKSKMKPVVKYGVY